MFPLYITRDNTYVYSCKQPCEPPSVDHIAFNFWLSLAFTESPPPPYSMSRSDEHKPLGEFGYNYDEAVNVPGIISIIFTEQIVLLVLEMTEFDTWSW